MAAALDRRVEETYFVLNRLVIGPNKDDFFHHLLEAHWLQKIKQYAIRSEAFANALMIGLYFPI